MDAPVATCPSCGKLGYEWRPVENVGWCYLCGFFTFYSSVEAFVDRKVDDGSK